MSINREVPTGLASNANVIEELWLRCADRLTAEELKWFTSASETAENQLLNLRIVTEGLGHLIGGDKTAGNFQSQSDTPNLLFAISESIDAAKAMYDVSNAAYHRLLNPELYRRLSAVQSESNNSNG